MNRNGSYQVISLSIVTNNIHDKIAGQNDSSIVYMVAKYNTWRSAIWFRIGNYCTISSATIARLVDYNKVVCLGLKFAIQSICY